MTVIAQFEPEHNASETLEYLTGIATTENTEIREAGRQFPRHVFTYEYFLDELGLARMDVLARSISHTQVELPVWTEFVLAPGTIGSGSTSVSIDTTASDFRNGGKVMLWQDFDTFAIKTITSLSGSAVGWTGTLGVALTDPLVMPVIDAYQMGEIRLVREEEPYTRATITFVGEDRTENGATPFSAYQSLDVVTDQNVRIIETSDAIVRSAFVADNGRGLFKPTFRKDYVDAAHQLQVVKGKGSEIATFKRWVKTIKGRQKAFWVPSWNRDIQVLATIGSAATSISVRDVGPVANLIGRHVMIEHTNGTRFYREITGGADGATDSLTISSSLGQTVTVDQIERVSFLHKVRFNQERMTLQYQPGYFMEFAAAVTEVPE